MDNLDVICPGTAFKIEYFATTEEFCASCGEEGSLLFRQGGSLENGLSYALNLEEVGALWQSSCVRDYLPMAAFADAFVLSSLAYHRFVEEAHGLGSLFYTHRERLQHDSLYAALFQMAARKFCEYKLAQTLPEFGKVLSLFNMATYVPYWQIAPGLGSYRSELEALEHFLYYHDIDISPNSADFAALAFPLYGAAIRTELKDLLFANVVVADWLLGVRNIRKLDLELGEDADAPKQINNCLGNIRSITEETLEEIVRKEKVKVLQAFMQNAATQVGKLAGVGRFWGKSYNASQFFLDTIKKYQRDIAELEYIFRQNFTSMKVLESFDGDINLAKQQEAYLASKTGEETRVYQYYLKRKVSVDIMIIRDVSGSTYQFEREYAEALIEILAAVNSFEGIRTLVIDFESGATLRKSFDQKLNEANIIPVSGGGTNMLPAVKLLEEQGLKGKRRLLFILSDGEINDRKQAEKELAEHCERNEIELIKLTFDPEDKYGYEHTSIMNLPKCLAQKIIARGDTDDEFFL
ncbi:MAG: vWA domain-containing protein [Phascolarctobacterium sp.]|nr:vWA domain-containing protein [Phascolarctobacterium sp.]